MNKLDSKAIEQLKKAKDILVKDAQIIRKDGDKRAYRTQVGADKA